MEAIVVRHQLAFTGIWLAAIASLFVLAGFEARGLAGGLVAGCWGYWPVSHWLRFHGNEGPVFALLFVASGLTVWACAWAMDKAKLRRNALLILLVSVAAGLFIGYGTTHDDFEGWKQWPAISAAMESQNYHPSVSDFHRSIVIPTTLMYGVWGLYAGAVGCWLF